MKYKIESSGIKEDKQHSSLLKIALQPEDTFKARASSMMSFGGDLKTSTTTTRSMWKAITTFENFPITKVKGEASGGGGVVTFSPPLPGEIVGVSPEGKRLNVQSLGFLGAPENFSINIDMDKMYKNDSLATLEIEEAEDSEDFCRVFIAGFGGITKVELDENERTHIGEDYLLAMDATVSFKRSNKSNIRQTAFGAHSTPNMDISGPGCVYMHSRSPFGFERAMDKLDKY